jgi:hypothetical protein
MVHGINNHCLLTIFIMLFSGLKSVVWILITRLGKFPVLICCLLFASWYCISVSSFGNVKFIFGCTICTSFGSTVTIPLTTSTILVFTLGMLDVSAHRLGAKFGATVITTSLLS